MAGLIGLGLGVGIGWSTATHSGSPLAVWLLWALSYWLVWRWGRRGRRSATAVAVAVAEAEATAAAVSQSAVNVYVGAPAGVQAAGRWNGLDSLPWLADSGVGQISGDYVRAIDSGDLESDDVDALDPAEAVERVTRSDPGRYRV